MHPFNPLNNHNPGCNTIPANRGGRLFDEYTEHETHTFKYHTPQHFRGVQTIVRGSDMREKILVFMPLKELMAQIEEGMINSGLDVVFTYSLPDTLKLLKSGEYAVLVCPLKDWGSEEEHIFLEYFNHIKGNTTIVVLTRSEDEKVDAYLKGGDIVITLPLTNAEAEVVLDEAIERYELKVQNKDLMEIVEGYNELIEDIAVEEQGIPAGGLFTPPKSSDPLTESLIDDLRTKYQEYEDLFHRNKLLKQRLTAILESTEEDMLFILDLVGRVRYISTGVEKILGIDKEKAKNKYISQIHPALNAVTVPGLSKNGKKKVETPSSSYVPSIEFTDINGERRLFDFTIKLLKLENRKQGYLIIGRDQTLRAEKLEEELRNRMRLENLTRVNLEMRMAKNLDEGYRAAIKNVGPGIFNNVVLFTLKGLEDILQKKHIINAAESEMSKDETEQNFYSVIRNDGLPLPFSGRKIKKEESAPLYLRAEYFRKGEEVWAREEFLDKINRFDLIDNLERTLSFDSHPFDRVLRGEELVYKKEQLKELKEFALLNDILELMNIGGDMALIPLIGKRGGSNAEELGEYFGILLVEKKEGRIDDKDIEYLRQYCQSIGLALENGHLLKGLYQTVEQLNLEQQFLENVVMRVSHEIITPLQPLLTNIYFARMDIDSFIPGAEEVPSSKEEIMKKAQKIRARIEKIQKNSERLRRMGEMLQNYRLVKDMKFSAAPQKLNVADIVTEIIQDYDSVFQMTQATVRNHLYEAELPEIIFDPDVLYVVLSMIIENAVLHMPRDAKGHIERNPEVDIDGRVDDGMVIIAIKDNGKGMTQEEMERIFTRLYRGVRTIHHKEGLGLGLTSAKMLIDYFGGTIRPYSEPGKGSIFEVIIPMNAGKEDMGKRAISQ